MDIKLDALLRFTRHACSVWPAEGCGVIIRDSFHWVDNIAEDPFQTFQMDPITLARLQEIGPVQAILHSHPYNSDTKQAYPPEWPSGMDMQNWMKGNVPWGIASCDGEGISNLVWLDEANPEPLIGREFIHGINDCYSLVRDWFRTEYEVTIPNFARGMEWWHTGKDLYSENFESAGFKEISKDDVRIGDCILIKYMSPVINHAGVITGNNELLHHMFHRLSGRDRLDKWERKVVKYVRYVGETK
jgi:proteasome lid subunit RPN8/RPN11